MPRMIILPPRTPEEYRDGAAACERLADEARDEFNPRDHTLCRNALAGFGGCSGQLKRLVRAQAIDLRDFLSRILPLPDTFAPELRTEEAPSFQGPDFGASLLINGTRPPACYSRRRFSPC